MKNSVVIKGNKSGIALILDKELSFVELKKEIAKKFQESAKFLGKAEIALSLEGRNLTNEQEREILDIINENCDLKIVCLIDTDKEREAIYKKRLDEKLMELSQNTGQFFKGNLRSGRVAEFDTSVVILGDVKPGAKVISKGNIVVLGSLKGNAFAGASGNQKSFIVALDMEPVQIRIGDVIARAPDEAKKESVQEAKIAFVEGGNIYIEPLDKEALNDISLE